MRKLRNAELNRLTISQYKEKPKNSIMVILDNVRSMHNVGSVFRTSDAFSVEKIALCGITGTPPHKEIRKTAIGAEKSVEWEYHPSTLDLVIGLKEKGYMVIGVEQTSESKNLSKHLFNDQPTALIFGNEVDGVSDEVLAHCDMCVEIPQFGTKHSFNISVSVALVLWEILR